MSTFQWWCSPETAPATRQPDYLKVLDSVIPVQAGDRIELQVAISFS